MKSFFKFFAIQCVQYFLVTANYRAIAQASYFWTAMTDMVFAAIGFFVIQQIADAKKDRLAWAGYVCGGVCGSLGAIFITKIVYGK